MSARNFISKRPVLFCMKRIRQHLLDGKPWTAETLAKEFEISAKTIHRDINFMRDFFNYGFTFDHRNNTFTGKVPPTAIL